MLNKLIILFSMMIKDALEYIYIYMCHLISYAVQKTSKDSKDIFPPSAFLFPCFVLFFGGYYATRAIIITMRNSSFKIVALISFPTCQLPFFSIF